MMTVILATAFCLTLTYIFTVKHYRIDDSRLSEPRHVTPTFGIQIICGNCCGNDERPVKTYLGMQGNCERCGGDSYVLASRQATEMRHLSRQRS